MNTEPDLDEYLAHIKSEQARVVDEEVPQKIAVAFGELFGDGWLLQPRIVQKYEKAVADVRAYLSAIAECGNTDYEAARSAGFAEDWRPVRH